MKVSADVLTVLDAAEADRDMLRLTGQLDRKLYEQTNKVLVAAGGKWTRRVQAHVFPRDAADIIDQIILTGEITTQQELGYFPTPARIVEQLLDLAELAPGMLALEPSAGRGAIAGPLASRGVIVDCIELQRDNALAISDANIGRDLLVDDFLCVPGEPRYDRVVMNPPFARQQDIAHVTHALRFLKPDGLLVAVMSAGVTFRQTQRTRDFRRLVDEAGGRFIPLPDGSFAESGTGVNTVIAVVPKPESVPFGLAG